MIKGEFSEYYINQDQIAQNMKYSIERDVDLFILCGKEDQKNDVFVKIGKSVILVIFGRIDIIVHITDLIKFPFFSKSESGVYDGKDSADDEIGRSEGSGSFFD